MDPDEIDALLRRQRGVAVPEIRGVRPSERSVGGGAPRSAPTPPADDGGDDGQNFVEDAWDDAKDVYELGKCVQAWLPGSCDLGDARDAVENQVKETLSGSPVEVGLNLVGMVGGPYGRAAKEALVRGCKVLCKKIPGLKKLFGGADDAAQQTEKIQSLTAQAAARYPKLAGKAHDHHIVPKYLGGAPQGPTVRIDAAYHQLITNEFRRLAPYGQPRPSPERLGEIVGQVYSKYPLPQ